MACVLIAEDDPLVLRMLSGLCRGLFVDLELLTARTVEEAISAFQTHKKHTHRPPDILITDLRMPFRSGDSDHQAIKAAGLKLTQIIRKAYPSLPILILSGILDEEAIIESMTSGAVQVIHKSTLDHPRVLKRALLLMLPERLFLSKEI